MLEKNLGPKCFVKTLLFFLDNHYFFCYLPHNPDGGNPLCINKEFLPTKK